MKRVLTLLITLMLLMSSALSYHVPVYAEEGTDVNEEIPLETEVLSEEDNKEEETLLTEEVSEEETQEEEEAFEQTQTEEETPAQDEPLPAEEPSVDEESSSDKEEAEVDPEAEMEQIEGDTAVIDAKGNPNNWPFRVVGNDGSVYLVIGNSDVDSWLKDAYRKYGSRVDFIDGNGNVVASYEITNTTRQNKVYLDSFYFYGHNHGLKIDVRKLVDDKLPDQAYTILVHVEGYDDYVEKNVNIKSLTAETLPNDAKANKLAKLNQKAPGDVTVNTNDNGDVIINSANKEWLQALTERKEEFSSFNDTVNGIPGRIVYIGGGFIDFGGVVLQNTGTTILSHDDAKNYHIPDDNPSVLAQETFYEYDSTNKYLVIPNEVFVDNDMNDGTYTLTLSAEGYLETTVTKQLDLKNPARNLDSSKVSASLDSNGNLVITCSDAAEGSAYLENLVKEVENGKTTSGGRILANGKYIYNTASDHPMTLSGNKVVVDKEAIRDAFNGVVSGSASFTIYSRSFPAVDRTIELPYIVSESGDDGSLIFLKVEKTYKVNTSNTVNWSVKEYVDGNLVDVTDTLAYTVSGNTIKMTANDFSTYVLTAVTNGITDSKEISVTAEGLKITADAKAEGMVGTTVSMKEAAHVKALIEAGTSSFDATESLNFSSGNESVATVDANGNVTFLASGTVEITSYIGSVYAKTVFTVYRYATNAALSYEMVNTRTGKAYDDSKGMEVGDTYVVNAKVDVGDGEPLDVDPSMILLDVANKAVVSGNANRITAVKKGSSAVTIKLNDTAVREIGKPTIKVVDKIFDKLALDVESISADKKSYEDGTLRIYLGISDVANAATYQIKATGTGTGGETDVYEDIQCVKYTVVDSKVASVSSSGELKVNGSGTTKITGTISTNPSTMEPVTYDIILTVIDFMPKLSTNKVTINAYMNEGTEFAIERAYEDLPYSPKIKSVSITGDFTVDYDQNSGKAVISAKDASAKSGKQTLTVVTDDSTYNFDFTVNVKNKLPSITVKTTGSYNTFTNENSLGMTYSSKELDNEAISVTFKDENGNSWASYDPADGSVTLTDPSVKSGNAQFHFEGYNQPLVKKVSFKTVKTKPAVKLLAATATVYSDGANKGLVVLKLVDNKKNPITEGKIVSVVGKDGASGNYTAQGPDAEGNIRILAASGNLSNDTLTISYKEDGWNETIDLKATIKVSDKLPTAKLSSTTLNLNSKYNPAGKVEINVSAASETVKGIRYEAVDGVGVSYDQAAGAVRVVASKAGTYKLSLTPYIQLNDGSDKDLKAVSLTVKVTDTDPKISLKTSTMKFNKSHKEVQSSIVKYSNAGFDYQITDIVNKTSADGAFRFEYDAAEELITVSKISDPAAGKYVYEIYPEINDIESDTPIKLTVNVYEKDATVKMSVKGNLNPLDADSAAIGTLKVSNYVGEVKDVVINSDKLSIEKVDEAYQITLKDRRIADQTIKENVTYTLSDGTKVNGEISVKVARKAPTVKAVPTVIEVYNMTNVNKVVGSAKLQISGVNAQIDSVDIDGAKGVYDVEVSGEMVYVTLKNPSAVKAGSSQSVTIKIIWVGDVGPKFKTSTVKLTIKDVSNKIVSK